MKSYRIFSRASREHLVGHRQLSRKSPHLTEAARPRCCRLQGEAVAAVQILPSPAASERSLEVEYARSRMALPDGPGHNTEGGKRARPHSIHKCYGTVHCCCTTPRVWYSSWTSHPRIWHRILPYRGLRPLPLENVLC